MEMSALAQCYQTENTNKELKKVYQRNIDGLYQTLHIHAFGDALGPAILYKKKVANKIIMSVVHTTFVE